jgi:hypothetical protein
MEVMGLVVTEMEGGRVVVRRAAMRLAIEVVVLCAVE